MSIISIYIESHGMQSLVDVEAGADSNLIADAVFQEADGSASDSRAVAEADVMEQEATPEVFMAAAAFLFVDNAEFEGVESNSAVTLAAAVWLFGSGLLLLATSGAGAEAAD